MKVLTYYVEDIGAPAKFHYMARLLISDAEGKPDLHPLVFHSALGHEDVESQAQAWWDAELAKVESRPEVQARARRLAAETRARKKAQEAHEVVEGVQVHDEALHALHGSEIGLYVDASADQGEGEAGQRSGA